MTKWDCTHCGGKIKGPTAYVDHGEWFCSEACGVAAFKARVERVRAVNPDHARYMSEGAKCGACGEYTPCPCHK